MQEHFAPGEQVPLYGIESRRYVEKERSGACDGRPRG